MKNVFFMFLMLFGLMASAQTNLQNAKLATAKGTYTVGLKTTNLGFTNVEGEGTSVDVGLTGGYFLDNKTAIVLGTGYSTYLSEGYNVNAWTYSAGIKHYLGTVVPIQVDWNGATGNGISPNMTAVGVQAGYAWFLTKDISLEPTVRYNMSLVDEYKNVLSGGFGVNYFF